MYGTITTGDQIAGIVGDINLLTAPQIRLLTKMIEAMKEENQMSAEVSSVKGPGQVN